MFAVELEADQRYNSISTLDIETNGFDGSTNELVAIGVGYYEPSQETPEIEVLTRAAAHGDEKTLIQTAYNWVNERNPDGLATYNGASFDFTFLTDRMEALGFHHKPTLSCSDAHVDLYPTQKQIADKNGEKWPSLEELLEAYEIPNHSTLWEGEELTNKRFGEVLAPRYLDALTQENSVVLSELEPTVIEYTASDIEATIALYRKYSESASGLDREGESRKVS